MSRLMKRSLIGMNISQIIAAFAPKSAGQSVLDKDLYYRATLAAAGGASETQLFHANAGDFSVTNIEENGRTPTGKHQLVEGIGVTLVGAHATEATRLVDVNLVADTGILEIEQDQTVVFRGFPLRKFLSGTSLTKIDATNGQDVGNDGLQLANPILLQGGKAYRARVRWPSGSPATTGDVKMTVELLGQEISE